MIYYVLLLITPVFSALQSVAQKQYNMKAKSPDIILFSALTCLTALVFFTLTSRFQLHFEARVVPWSLGFALGYATSFVGSVYAVRCGSVSLTLLVVSLAMVFPTVYGVMLGEAVSVTLVLGLMMLVGSLVLVNLNGKGGRAGAVNLRWLKWVTLGFLGNGACMMFSNIQKRVLGDGFTFEFMIVALGICFALLMGLSLVKSRGLSRELKPALPYAALNGTSNGVVNLLVLLIVGNIPNTILYPTNAALSMLLTFLIAYFVYKERYSRAQYIGYAMGVVSVILLNI